MEPLTKWLRGSMTTLHGARSFAYLEAVSKLSVVALGPEISDSKAPLALISGPNP
jgi:hypothetical protein